MPMIGGGFDGNYYSQKGNEDIIRAVGNGSRRPPASSFTNGTDVMKKLGATKIAVGRLRRVAVVDRRRPRHCRSTPRRPRGSIPCT